MQHITDAQVAQLLDYRGVTERLRQAFQDLADKRAAIHPRQRSACEGIKLSTMGAIWQAAGVAGVKVYPTVAGQFGFAVLLFDLATNRPLAVIDGRELTRFRTAAITALVASQVVAPEARALAVFGAGQQGCAQVEALSALFRFDDIRVVDPRADDAVLDRLQRATGRLVRRMSAEDAVRGADIVVTATASAQPVFDGAWLEPGTFVSAIGTSTPANRELDDTTLARAARILVEWRPQSLVEAGEIVQWEGRHRVDKFVDLPQLFGGEQPWRGESADITVFKSVGVGLADVATAHLVIERLRDAAAVPAPQEALS